MQFAWELPNDLPRRLLIGGLLIVGAAVAYWWFSMPVETTPAPAVVMSSGPRAQSGVVVDVVGAVRRPGVVRLPSGSRVIDAVNAAGGLRHGARAVVNLARVLVDGEQIVVGTPNAGGGIGNPASSDGKVSINAASASQIEALPGVGPVLAERIVDYRTKHGPFAQVRDLLNVPGIGDAKYAQLADAVTL